jgi:NAD(P)-dependent dehydrogenase (short-subunit alcohol dehydrogenase family)
MTRVSQRMTLVTGGDAGIGRSICEALRADGMRIFVNGLSGAPDVAAALGEDCVGFDADIGIADDRKALIDATALADGIDVLVLNAAIQHRARWYAVKSEELRHQFDVNFAATVELVQAFAPRMIERGWGRIVMIGSVQEVKPNPELPIYAALKAAQGNLVRNLARDLARSGVTCNVVSPGVVETTRSHKVLSDPNVRASWLERIPAGRFGTADECAAAVRFLASDSGAYITGQTIRVDGGLSIT